MQPRYRLRETRDFERLRREGRTYHDRLLTLSIAPNALSHNRYGFVTGRRLGKAVARNRVRRLLREATRKLHPQLKSGFDVVLVARPALVGQPFTEVQRIVANLFRQAGVMEGGADE